MKALFFVGTTGFEPRSTASQQQRSGRFLVNMWKRCRHEVLATKKAFTEQKCYTKALSLSGRQDLNREALLRNNNARVVFW